MRIGYLAPHLGDTNGLAIWSGLTEIARPQGIDLICFAGGELHQPGHPAALANMVFELAEKRHLDGVILWASALGNYVSQETLLAFCRRFAPLPMVSIGVALPGIPGVVLDSYGGTSEAIKHLVCVHGRRRLACIRGPVTNREAQERFRAYSDAVELYGLAADPDLVSPPYTWAEPDGTAAVRLFLEERRTSFDGIVAANDALALGAQRALQRRGYHVPDDVALLGFNDAQEGRVASPPLTTVKIRMFERGRQALRLLLDLMAGIPVPDEHCVPGA